MLTSLAQSITSFLDLRHKNSFKKVFEAHYRPLCNYAFQLLQDNALAEDLVQDVFTKLWQSRRDLSQKDIKISYLYKMTKNRVLEYLRSEKAKQSVYAEMDLTQVERTSEDAMATHYERLELLYDSLRHLPPKCKEVFALSKFNGLTYAEIADSLNISQKTVENHMLKAIKILRTHLIKKA